MKSEGWRHVWQKWHYFRDGSSLCGKFGVQIIGGGEPRRRWRATLTAEDRKWPICDACKRLKA